MFFKREARMPNLGDIITDHVDGMIGIVRSVEVHRWGEGTFATAPEEVMVAIESGEWTTQSNLKTAWGWEFPRSNKDD